MFDNEPVLEAFGAKRELRWEDRGPKSYLVAGKKPAGVGSPHVKTIMYFVAGSSKMFV